MDSLELIGQATESVVPQLTVDEETEKFARLIAEPLESGYGITLGNALRRVLLSSLEGAAITSVRVEQVQHEFSTILGLQEDTTEFLLNAKEIRIRALSNRSGTLALDIEGPCKVTAGDLQVPADFEIVNPELHLATIDVPKARLNVEFHAELGKGYVPAGSVEGLPIGVIPVDAIFTPVRKVNYRVEKTRVGQSTNYDRLILEVWTDGTIGPIDAVGQSADILMDQFALFSQMGRPDVSMHYGGPVSVGTPSTSGLLMAPDRYNTPIEDLALSVRAYNCLKRSGLMTVGQVLEKSEDELLALRNFGRKSYDELRDRLIELGYVDGTAEGLVPIVDSPVAKAPTGRPGGPMGRPIVRTGRASSVIMDEDEEEENLSALGKALKEALLKDGSADDLIGADDED
ncbi:MAG: DNA-directed RNA polymerase subunit alpha [Dehalococcoidia bacterium]|uniref:DNA-directed RNA polymerase subunit alpha n=1 Tax=Candidatus Amarobacter glycogenicus TaxID=3140699 RepID=UPI001D8D3A62|nr:DNA-directed RNA polymerase subunit alpha [Dehalococcoidia bacterium]MBK6563489.1 DNA-directed RNA polymerase subunit alpha [Dehalococcoidia bacterium]MBK7127522.1 DNA-directed RNA polymerase subunit alpha [Dehalococcoidia bacterium]MBK7724850.1 DNA-directed RNA polymerase subunit alpha [Dehalococcoidia bacterium]MBK8560086.1 DNA-directed RNA polymerase subunit alpha [Dehalococcoidia bacterium]